MGNVVSALMFDRVKEERDHYKRKCEEYCKRIFELGEELKKRRRK